MMTVEYYKELYRDLIKDKTHSKYCYCPSCLFQFRKKYFKHSRKRKDNFFIGWLIVQVADIEYKNGKIKLNVFLEDLKKPVEFYYKNLRTMTKLEAQWGYDANLTEKIYSFLVDCHNQGKNLISTRMLSKHFSHKRKEDIFPCLFFLKRVGLIRLLFKNKRDKKILYLGGGKELKDVLPPWIYSPIFNAKELLKEFSS